ncbi:glycoside hydrolase family 68 protein [Novosphingobium sp.]|uniref:glycoside hydrolase family 68 protein n=1 Tax=Novosphingobium sp. TaxID=1874826 RepID=UPI0025ED21D8|nr:glycoside hydrolase family 68 protein [Novosphingobium sp.]
MDASLPAIMTRNWTAQDLQGLHCADTARLPVIGADQIHRISSDLDVWDSWPLADTSGQPVAWCGGELWFALAAPAFADPEERHGHARIHTFHRTGTTYLHLGQTIAEGLTPGSREWSGAARLEGSSVSLYFTAAGIRGECPQSFCQRLFVTKASLTTDQACPFGAWSSPEELLRAASPYMPADQREGRAGEIKAFRDPCPWQDADGARYLLFTASAAAAPRAFNGVIGIARGDAAGRAYTALPPLIDATDVNNELERPHIVRRDGRLYLFWSTQSHVFAPGISAPTGLYGATAHSVEGPWELLNQNGLVLANPMSEPFQSYSWWVMPDLQVAAFIDYWGLDDEAAQLKPAGRTHFGGTFAPFVSLSLEGARSSLSVSTRSSKYLSICDIGAQV